MNKLIEAKLNNVLKAEIKSIKDSDAEPEDKLERIDTIINLKKILDSYDELEPVLKQFFADKAVKDKWITGEER